MSFSKTFVLISPKNRTVYNFRGDLIRSIIERGYDVLVVGPNREDIDKILKLGVKFVEIPMHKNGINPIADLKYLWHLTKVLSSEQADVTLGYTIKPVIYGAIAAKIAGVKSINSMITGAGYLFISESGKAKILKRIGSILYKIGLRCTDHVLFQNKDDLNEFVEHHLVAKDKCYLVNGSGVNMKHFYRTPLPNKITFFMLSRVMVSKGICEYLSAAYIVKAKYPDVRFMLLGAIEKLQDSLPANELQPYINKGIIEYFEETADVREYITQCSVFVLPSYREGTPRTVLEAMSMGRAIITSDAPGCRETVKNGKNGFLIEVRNVNSLVQKMIWMIEHSAQLEKMGNNSYLYCKERFEVSKVNIEMHRIMGIDKL